jgi:hypothetical protein
MSAIGPKQTWPSGALMSAFGGKADIEVKGFYFSFDPKRTFRPLLVHKVRRYEVGLEGGGSPGDNITGEFIFGCKWNELLPQSGYCQ